MPRFLVALAVCVVAGCGGGGGDRESFVSDVNEACRDYRAVVESDPPPETMDAYTEALEEEIGRWKDADAPDEDREQFEQMIRHQEEGLEHWKAYVVHVEADDREKIESAMAQWRKSFVTAAGIADELGLDDCDRALS